MLEQGDVRFFVMTDAERLIRNFARVVASAPYALAPERADELQEAVFEGESWTLALEEGPAQATARVDRREIVVTFAALLGLWAVARAAMIAGVEAIAASRADRRILDSGPNSPMAEALALIAAAEALIRDPCAAWPDGLPHPDAAAPEGSDDWRVNNVFLGAVGWICLHEVAHIHLGHEPDTTDALRRRQENEADSWATRWVLDRAPPDLRREFRVFAIAAGLAWIALVDKVRRGSLTHPHAWERLGHCAQVFGTEELSPGLELSTHAMKACFFPHDPIEDFETPQEAFFGTLFAASRLPR
ncbi:phage exclusion protein Lit family protein [Methylocystis hirsuta]|uniref:ImmA/IrrE family metallo-endopeptidase n=1 Tax=Methylocystis hirsuta TaxID=369798 RepID=A0A3M9XLV2_9HYPH|nr:phage exclusion protein Lit family protein [Methylocystis hirsuta]RNJ48048.1 hypothetical protein D1O30_19600 [Methylocystis hirsuta]